MGYDYRIIVPPVAKSPKETRTKGDWMFLKHARAVMRAGSLSPSRSVSEGGTKASAPPYFREETPKERKARLWLEKWLKDASVDEEIEEYLAKDWPDKNM